MYSTDTSPTRFAAHLIMASNWLSSEHTFNAPIWSVSIEVLVYFLFYAATRYVPLRGVVKSLLILGGGVAACVLLSSQKHQLADAWIDFRSAAWFAECLVCFYLGGLAYDLHAALSQVAAPRRIFVIAIVLSVVGSVWWLAPLRLAAVALPAAVILLLAEAGDLRPSNLVVRASWVGNLTYGSYLCIFLWHC